MERLLSYSITTRPAALTQALGILPALGKSQPTL